MPSKQNIWEEQSSYLRSLYALGLQVLVEAETNPLNESVQDRYFDVFEKYSTLIKDSSLFKSPPTSPLIFQEVLDQLKQFRNLLDSLQSHFTSEKNKIADQLMKLGNVNYSKEYVQDEELGFCVNV